MPARKKCIDEAIKMSPLSTECRFSVRRRRGAPVPCSRRRARPRPRGPGRRRAGTASRAARAGSPSPAAPVGRSIRKGAPPSGEESTRTAPPTLSTHFPTMLGIDRLHLRRAGTAARVLERAPGQGVHVAYLPLHPLDERRHLGRGRGLGRAGLGLLLEAGQQEPHVPRRGLQVVTDRAGEALELESALALEHPFRLGGATRRPLDANEPESQTHQHRHRGEPAEQQRRRMHRGVAIESARVRRRRGRARQSVELRRDVRPRSQAPPEESPKG